MYVINYSTVQDNISCTGTPYRCHAYIVVGNTLLDGFWHPFSSPATPFHMFRCPSFPFVSLMLAVLPYSYISHPEGFFTPKTVSFCSLQYCTGNTLAQSVKVIKWWSSTCLTGCTVVVYTKSCRSHINSQVQ